MSSITLEKVLEEVKSLTLEERRQLLERLEQEDQSTEQAERNKLAGSIRGKYAGILSSSENFATRKAEEIALEDRR